MRHNSSILIPVFVGLMSMFFWTCDTQKEMRSSEANILSFSIEQGGEEVTGLINSSRNDIRLEIPHEWNIEALAPTVEVSAYANVSPASGEEKNFTKEVYYTVTAENGDEKQYTVYVTQQAAPQEIALQGMVLPELYQEGSIEGTEVSFSLPYGTALDAVKIKLDLSNGVVATPSSGSTVDLSAPLTLVLEKEGQVKEYTVKATSASTQEVGVRGVWLTNVASDALISQSTIDNAVNRIADYGFNTIFVVTYNKSNTLHPSTVMQETVGYPTPASVTFYRDDFDRLAYLIEKAHARDLKVIAWFEYGFASHYEGQPSPILNKHPDWASEQLNTYSLNGVTQNITRKNNFYWLNGFHPEVQQFMHDLILEVVNNYEVDGIQGDDRLPAMPINGGYDAFTKRLYKEETGKEVPTSDAETHWKQWRADKLSDFGEWVYKDVKEADPNCLVTWSPSPRGWSLDNYLQDWEEWLRRGIVDVVSPQLYRKEEQGLGAYTSLLKGDLDVLAPYSKHYYPGILTRVGDYIPSDEYLVNLVRYNRKQGVQGEVWFFYEALWSKRKVFPAIYPAPAKFPENL
ncbi:glycoside hydrolase family 10 protein [Algivirga pacifica]|uniref:Glycosyl hydrolase-like 10 n=1 Tax=Algivirga pacifica TaxID=1162670 RepID=A0ABP9D4Z0_9BACT